MPTPKIEILRAHQSPEDTELGIEASLYVWIEIAGYKTGVGGLPVFDTKEELLDYLNPQYDSLLIKAKARPPDVEVNDRFDLVDEEYRPRDLEAELDTLKAQVAILEDNAGLYVVNYLSAKDTNPLIAGPQPYPPPDNAINNGIDYGMATTDVIIIVLLATVIITVIINKVKGRLDTRRGS